MGQGQHFDGCLSQAQLYELYSGNVQSMGQTMGRQRFFMVSSDNNVTFMWQSDTIVMNLCNWQFAQGFNDIYVNVFYKEGFYNLVEYNTTAACANKLLLECKEKYMEQYNENEGDDEIDESNGVSDSLSMFPIIKKTAQQLTFNFKEGYRILFPEENANGDQFLIQIYNPENFRQLIRLSKTQMEQQLVARQIKEQTILRNIAIADSLAKIGDFPTAIHLLEEIYDLLPDYIYVVDKKLGAIKKQYKEKKIQTYTENGEMLYNSGDYNGALEMFSNVLKEDLNNKNAKDRIDNINRKLNILHQRGQITYEYRECNPQNYMEFRNALENELNQLVDNTNYGTLNMTYSIIFDTMGINQSFYNILDFNTIAVNKNLPLLQSRMSHLLGHKSLQPSYSEGIPIRSATTFNINMDWDSYTQQVVKKRKKIVNKSPYALHPLIEDALQNNPKMYYGKYQFNIKSKSCNDQAYHDIDLTKYKTVGGEAFFYGLIPGLGTLIATQGKEGAACMVLSILCYGGATASYFLYKDFNKKYNETSASLSEKDAKKLNTKKEVCKWSSIAGFSIGGAIQLGGMIKAMVRGIQNKKNSKELRQALQNEPLEIKKENIHIQ
jgi:tetratricopeptide (TPR) repeat protein